MNETIQLEQLDRENVHPDLVRYWLFDKRVVVYQPANTNRDTVDAWVEITKTTQSSWRADIPYMELHDMRDATITPYSRARANELTDYLQDVEGYSAILIASSGIGNLIGFFVNRVFNNNRQKMQRKVFTSMDEAIAWLQSHLD